MTVLVMPSFIKKMRIGYLTKKTRIRTILYTFLVFINLMVVILGVTAWQISYNHHSVFDDITTEKIPAMETVSEIIILGGQLNDVIARSSNVTTKEDIYNYYREAVGIFTQSSRLRDELEGSAGINQDILTELEDSFGALKKLLSVHSDYIANKIIYQNAQNKNFSKLKDIRKGAILHISGQVSRDIYHEIEELYNTLLLVDPIDHADDVTLLRHRYKEQVEHIKHYIDKESNPVGKEALQDYLTALSVLTEGETSIFDVQEHKAQAVMAVTSNMDAMQKATHRINQAVTYLTKSIRKDVDNTRLSVDQQVMRGKITIVTLTGLCFLITVVISWIYVHRKLIGRMTSLRKIMNELSNNNFQSVIPARNDQDEIGDMARSVYTFREKMIENKILNEDLKIVAKKAEEASQAKSEFLANMSHELRTPLNSIIGLSRILISDLSPDQEEQEMAKTVNRSAQSLLTIVNDILDLSKIEAQQISLEQIGFDLKTVIQSVVELCAPMASSKGLVLEYSYDDFQPDQPYFIGDPARVGRIFINLVGNAIKYTLEGTVKIRISCRSKQAGVSILSVSVQDTGIGIAADKLDKVFEKFSQADETTTRRFGGTGLGLAITKELVTMMRGRIWVQSAVDIGSDFQIEIPFATTSVLADEVSPKDIKASESKNMDRKKIPLAEVRILIAEDHELNQVFIKKLLGRMGFVHFQIVETGIDAVKAYSSGYFNFILMDCHMPEMNGYQATQTIREKESDSTNHHIPIIALTADAMIGTREKCLESGMDDFITKPIDVDKFEHVLTQWIDFDDRKMPAHSQDENAPVGLKDKNSTQDVYVDFTALDQYADTKEERVEYLSMFISNMVNGLDGLDIQCTDGENKQWVEIVHKMKGGAGMIGAVYLSTLCAQAQSMILASADERKEILVKIKEAYYHTLDIFEEEKAA